MFCLDGRAAVLAGFVACEENYSAGFFCESFKHTASHFYKELQENLDSGSALGSRHVKAEDITTESERLR